MNDGYKVTRFYRRLSSTRIFAIPFKLSYAHLIAAHSINHVLLKYCVGLKKIISNLSEAIEEVVLDVSDGRSLAIL